MEWCQEQAAVSRLSQLISRPTEIAAIMFWADRLVQARARLSFLQNVCPDCPSLGVIKYEVDSRTESCTYA